MHIKKYAEMTTKKVVDLNMAITELDITIRTTEGLPDSITEGNAKVRQKYEDLSKHLFDFHTTEDDD